MQNRFGLFSFFLIISILSLQAQTNGTDKVRKNEISINILPTFRLLAGNNASNSPADLFGIYRHFYNRNVLRVGILGYSNQFEDKTKRSFTVKDSAFSINNPQTIQGHFGLFGGWERHSKDFDLNKMDFYYGIDLFGTIGDSKTYDSIEEYKLMQNGVYQLSSSPSNENYDPTETIRTFEVGGSPFAGLRIPVKKRSVFGFECAMNLGFVGSKNVGLQTNNNYFNSDAKFRITYGARF